MPSSVRVKVCGITRTADAQSALTLGVDYLGLNLWPQTPRCVQAELLPALFDVIPLEQRVCVDVLPKLQTLSKHTNDFAAFQLHFPHETPLEQIHAWANTVGKEHLWLAPRFPPETPFPEWLLEHANTFVIDAFRKDAYGGTGHTANWDIFRTLRERFPDKRWLLAGGLNPENIGDALRQSGANFIDINSGVEDNPGLKNPDRLRQLFKALERAKYL